MPDSNRFPTMFIFRSDVSGIQHYNDVIMGAIASRITSLTIVYSTVYSGEDQRKHQTPRHWPLWGGFSGDRWISRTKGQWRGKCFHLMTSSWGSWLESSTWSNSFMIGIYRATYFHVSSTQKVQSICLLHTINERLVCSLLDGYCQDICGFFKSWALSEVDKSIWFDFI